MITKSELEKLLASTETCRVERFKSATDKNKFGEAETGEVGRAGASSDYGII